MIPHCVYKGNPLTVFEIGDFANQLKKDFKNEKILENLVQKYLIDNHHKILLRLVPDPDLLAE